ncbi:citrulline utilization hydrolase CtlX [Arundinibacter roseus]|uniref:Amidinotransferase n=1 Tax=Arundinibacter roseus TaxID=2070510 RepID=A0A4R4KBE5_9BACT|nr:arginine deiminase-related protein [Arundinibacter roseus]TDB65197.1 amidinotransferase [Arundinibacter roseus]
MRVIHTSTHVQPQSTSRILMIRPVRFTFNDETAGSNEFQDVQFAESTAEIAHQKAAEEFEQMVHVLTSTGVQLTVFDDTPQPFTPDSIFPNNWISLHQSGKVVLYPMMALNRRAERRMDIIDELRKTYHVEEIIDLTHFEQEGKYLEGTGSMVLDRRFKIAYACLSPRTHPEVLQAFADATGYEIVQFEAVDSRNVPIYHTNVLMCVGDVFAVICLEAIKNPDERNLVRSVLEETGKYIVEITLDQMAAFAGNMLLVRTQKETKVLMMSSRAFHALTEQQRDALDDYAALVHADLSVIEGNGGGSARCMMAEIHLPLK